MLAVWVSGLALGVSVALYLPSLPWVGGLAGILLSVASAMWYRGLRVLGVAVVLTVAGLALGTLEVRAARRAVEWASTSPVRIVARVRLGPDPLPPRVDGRTQPEDKGDETEGQATGERARLLLDVESVEGRPADLRLLAVVQRGPLALAPGDTVAFQARLAAPRGFANPGEPDPVLALRARGADLVTSLRSAAELQVLARGRPGLRRWAHRLRGHLRNAITAAMDPVHAAFLRTTVLGERAAVASEVEEGFRAAGATHVLSVSGLHLAAVAALAFLVLRQLAARIPSFALRVRPAAVAALAATPIVVFYALVTGEAVATMRSAWMAVVVFGGGVAGRAVSSSASIAFAALVLLLMCPLVVVDVSFQLTFVSVVVLAAFSRRLVAQPTSDEAAAGEPRGRLSRGLRKATRWLVGFLAVTFTTGIGTAPLLAHHFGELTVAAPLGNLVLVPLVELCIVPLGLLGACVGAAYRTAGTLLLAPTVWAARAALAAAGLFRRFVPLWEVWRPGALSCAALVAAAFATLAALTAWRSERTRPVRSSAGSLRARTWFCMALALLFAGSGGLVVRVAARHFRAGIEVTFLDVGQGDAAVIEGPHGFVALVDGGGLPGSSVDVGTRVLVPYLRRRAISRIDLVILSHPHPDHLQGLLPVLQRFPVAALWSSGDTGHNPEYEQLLSLARARGAALERPRAFARDGVAWIPHGPFVGDVIGPPEGLSVNDASLTVRMQWGSHSVFFAGDLEEDGEAEILGRWARSDLQSAVLKVPHHGSRTSSSTEIIEAVSPRLAVMSLGHANRFGFPNPQVVARYLSHGVRVLRTDRDGAITLSMAATGAMNISCVRGCGGL